MQKIPSHGHSFFFSSPQQMRGPTQTAVIQGVWRSERGHALLWARCFRTRSEVNRAVFMPRIHPDGVGGEQGVNMEF